MKYSYEENLKKVEEQEGLNTGSDLFYRVEEGNDNVVRVLTPAEVIVYYFAGQGKKPFVAYGHDEGDPRKKGTDEWKPSPRFAMYVIDRKDGGVKLAEFPYSVQKALSDLQKNPDYSFDEVPMPYDIRITYNKSEAPATMYKVSALPKHTPVTDEENEALEERMRKLTPADYVEKKKEAQKTADQEAGIWRNPEQVLQANQEFHEKAISETKNSRVVSDTDVPLSPGDIPF